LRLFVYPHQSLQLISGDYLWGAPDSIPSRLARDEKFDVLILASSALDGFIRDGVVQPDSRMDLVSFVIGARSEGWCAQVRYQRSYFLN